MSGAKAKWGRMGGAPFWNTARGSDGASHFGAVSSAPPSAQGPLPLLEVERWRKRGQGRRRRSSISHTLLVLPKDRGWSSWSSHWVVVPWALGHTSLGTGPSLLRHWACTAPCRLALGHAFCAGQLLGHWTLHHGSLGTGLWLLWHWGMVPWAVVHVSLAIVPWLWVLAPEAAASPGLGRPEGMRRPGPE